MAKGESRKGESRGMNKKTWCTEFEAREADGEKNGKWSLSLAAGNDLRSLTKDFFLLLCS